jgi:ABC-type antimicrobial peptide transport system permease subunit
MVIGAFAVLALVLAVVGVYGVLAQNVAQRTREIGVRMALGARRGQIGTLVARQAAVLVAIGLALGAAGAIGASRFVRAMLFDVSPVDPVTLTAMAAVLAGTAAFAAGIPARRAAKLDPLRALREE